MPTLRARAAAQTRAPDPQIKDPQVGVLEQLAEVSLRTGSITSDDIRRRLWLYPDATSDVDPEQLQRFKDRTDTLPRRVLAKLAVRVELVS